MSMFNKAMREACGVNMSGAAINFAVLLRVFHAADLRWEMHPAQLFSIELISTFLEESVTVVETEVKAEDVPTELMKNPKYTLLGVPVLLRQDYPKTWIRLYAGTKLVGYLENLAIPSAYCNGAIPWEDERKAETDKAQKLWDIDNA